MNRYQHNKGYSLVETLIAVAILMLAIVGPMTIAAKSIQSAQYSLQQNTAFFLAQEGISIINVLRNNAALIYLDDTVSDPWLWAGESELDPCFTSDGCNIDYSDDTLLSNVVDCSVEDACKMHYDNQVVRAPFNNATGEESPYTRIITLENTTNDEVEVNVTVTWDSVLLGQGRSVTLTTHLFNIYKDYYEPY